MINFFKALWDNMKFVFIPLLIITPIVFLGALLELWFGFSYILYLLIILGVALIVVSIFDARGTAKMAERGVIYEYINELEIKAQEIKEDILNTDDGVKREKLYAELQETLIIINELRSRLENM